MQNWIIEYMASKTNLDRLDTWPSLSSDWIVAGSVALGAKFAMRDSFFFSFSVLACSVQISDHCLFWTTFSSRLLKLPASWRSFRRSEILCLFFQKRFVCLVSANQTVDPLRRWWKRHGSQDIWDLFPFFPCIALAQVWMIYVPTKCLVYEAATSCISGTISTLGS